MRFLGFLAALMLSACGTILPASFGSNTTTTTLMAADAATSLAVGERVTMTVSSPRNEPPEGQDAAILMRLRHADGRVMSFDESNHAPMHVMAQAPGGPLAQIMGLFGEERPTLYGARGDANQGDAFICGPDGPAAVGYYRGADGGVQLVGLRQGIEFEALPNGDHLALPYSPDRVCARLRFRIAP